MGFVLFIKSCTIIFLIWFLLYLIISQIKYYSEPEKDIFSGGKAGDVIIERSNGMKEKITKVCMKIQGEWVEMPNVEGVLQTDENGCIIGSCIRKKKNKEEKNMREIKVGDKVKVISITHEDKDCCPTVGDIYTVVEIRTCPFSGSNYAVFKETDFKGLPLTCYLFNCKLVDEKEKQFKKSDLKSGDIVELRNGDRYILIKNARHNQYDTPTDIFMSINKFGSIPLSWYSDSLLNSNGDKSYDIMKISDSFYIPNIFRTHPSGTLVVPDWAWEREETEEMTLEEVCKELGRDIKIVKEH